MKKVTNFIKKHWLLIGALISVLLDVKYGVLEGVFNNPDTVTSIRGIGMFIYAYLWTSPKNKKDILKESGIILPKTKK